jgi:hypothetical protein
LERERRAVQTAADHLTHEQIADAWRQAQVGATAALAAITDAVGVRYRAAYQDDDAIILVFQRGNGRCLDLASRPGGNTVKARDC